MLSGVGVVVIVAVNATHGGVQGRTVQALNFPPFFVVSHMSLHHMCVLGLMHCWS